MRLSLNPGAVLGAGAALALALMLGACSSTPGLRPGDDRGGTDGGPDRDGRPAGDAADAGEGDGGPGPGFPRGPSCDEEPHELCDHPVNRVVIPLLRGAGTPLKTAPAAELCRRVAIDLLGRAPTAEELDRCREQTPAEMADTFLADPAYERNRRRSFSELAGYDVFRSWYAYLVEMDELVGRHYREELSYLDLISQLVTHPGYFSRFPYDDWSANVVQLAFGRPARQDEIDGLRPLTQVWFPRFFCDGALWYQLSAFGEDVADMNCFRLEWALNFCGCEPRAGSAGCRSTTLGTLVDWTSEGCVLSFNYFAEVNFLRATEASPGRPPRCPTGLARQSCADRTYSFETYTPGEQILPLAEAGKHRQRMIAELMTAFSERGDFWEAAVDRELRRLLGWWQTAFRRPDTDLPEVRLVLADELRKGGSLREIERLIVTSLLYTLPAERPEGQGDEGQADAPPFTQGPSKFLAAEPWLDSLGVALGEDLGRCDHRFQSAIAFGELFVDQALLEPIETSLGPAFDAARYLESATALGGCTAGEARPTVSSIGVVAAQRRLAQELCAVGRAVLPEGFDAADDSDEALVGGIEHLYERLLSRSPGEDEVTALRDEMRACLAQGEAGCGSPEAALRWSCQRLVDSAEFAIY